MFPEGEAQGKHLDNLEMNIYSNVSLKFMQLFIHG